VMTLTTTGYGDIVPTNELEVAYMIFMMIASALTFSTVVSEVSRLLASLNRHAATVDAQLDAVKQYVQWRALPADLASRVKRHYKHKYETRAPFDEMDLLDGCPYALRAEVIRCLSQGHAR